MATAGRACPRTTHPTPAVGSTSSLLIADIDDRLPAGPRRTTAATVALAQSNELASH